ncbi:hypothetical protein, partial [Collimonas sp. OK412]|uniref:hypothetical protein n=1 Tax=Collimonas sp. (strain OK412) TaxID=1801619 RepID=UPI0008E5BE53
WYLIADANGLTNGDHIAAGQVISIPNKVSNFHNTASTFRVYNPGQAIGDTLPYLPTEPLPPPPPSSDGGCGSFVQFLAMVVAIVVTIYTAGAVPPAWGPVAAGAIGGAAGATASQAVLIAGGQQNGFDWTGVAMGAIGGAVAGGVVQYGPALQGSSAFTQGVVRGAITSVVSQGVEVATGLQSHFDWRSVAASAIATGVSAGVADSIGRSQFGDKGWEAVRSGASMSDAGQTMTRGIAAGLAAGAASSLVRGGSFQNNLPGILRDVVASTIGNAVVDQMAATPTKIYGYDDGNTPVGEKFQLADRSGSANGMTEGQYWNGPARTVADQYADVYGGSVVNATGRPVRTSDGLTVSDGGERGNTKFTRLNGIDKGADSLTPKRTHDVSYMITDPAEFLDARNTQTSTWNDYVDSTAANPYGDKANDQALRIAYNRQWTDGVMVGSAQGSGLLPAQEFVNRNGMLYDSPLGGAVYGGLRTVGVNDNTARAFGALGNSVEMAGAVATGAPFAKPRTVNVVGVNNAAVVGDAVPTLGPGWSVTAPRGLGSATGPLPPGYTTVSRWVSPDEAATWMQNGGTAIPTGIGAGNRVYVTALDAAKPGGTGPIRIDFAVPEKALSTAGKPEWFQMFQPMPSTPVYNVQIHVPPGTVIPKVK